MSGELYPLFITSSSLSASTVNSFITTSAADPKLDTGNIWLLITSSTSKPDDTTTPTSPEVKTLTVEKTLQDASLDKLGEIAQTICPDQGCIMFCILDSRSSDEETALLVKWEVWSEYVDPNATSGLDDAANRRQREGWQTLRVKWANAARVMDGIEYLAVHEVTMTKDGFEGDVYVL